MLKFSFPVVFIYIFVLAAPFVLWPLEYLFPFPYIFEELFKACLVLVLVNIIDSKKEQLSAILIGGFLFAFSESMFYIINVFLAGNVSYFYLRLAMTIPLHLITIILIYVFVNIDRRLVVVGIIFAALVHYLYNLQTL